jgi:sigma-E factor negative regulatory protein RseA
MEKDQKNRQQISEFMDGELDQQQITSVISCLRQPSGREQWDIYHRIGDLLRSDDMAYSASENLCGRVTARLDNEPTFIRPTKSQVKTIVGSWPKTAAAAVLTGFLIAPMMFHWSGHADIPMSIEIPSKLESEAVLLADAGSETVNSSAQLIHWHQSSTPSLYGLRTVVHPASFTSQPRK